MGVTDDIIVSVIIVFFVIFIGIFVLFKTTSNEKGTMSVAYEESLQTTFGTAFDAALHLKEPRTGNPFEILIGNYLLNNKKTVATPSGTVDLIAELTTIFDTVYGRNNYYMHLSPRLSNVYVSFVIDGTDSMNDERRAISTRIKPLNDEIEKIFKDTGSKVHINIFILSPLDDTQACADFASSVGSNINCMAVSSKKLYDPCFIENATMGGGGATQGNVSVGGYCTQNSNCSSNICCANACSATVCNPALCSPSGVVMVAPSINGKTMAQWEAQRPAPGVSRDVLAMHDWIAGSMYAINYVLKQPKQSPDLSLHIVIPISDQLSTSAIPDDCFDRTAANSQNPTSDYDFCALCDERCPAHREDANLNATTAYVETRNQASNSITILPVFSFDCSFSYNAGWNEDAPTTFTDNYCPRSNLPLPASKSLCDQNPSSCGGLCKACKSDPNPDKFCFRSQCNDAAKAQMTNLSTVSGNESIIDIAQPDALTSSVVERIRKIYEDMQMRIGVRDERRAHYVVQRTLLLPDDTPANVSIWTYEGAGASNVR